MGEDCCHLERIMVIGNNELIKSNKLIKLNFPKIAKFMFCAKVFL